MENIYDYIFLYTLYSMFVLIWLGILGIGTFAPKYLDSVQTFLKLYIGILLFARFNPVTYKDRPFREFDRRIVFTCSIFLLLTTAVGVALKRHIQKKAGPLVDKSLTEIKSTIGIES